MPEGTALLRDDVRILLDLARDWVEIGWRHTPEEPSIFVNALSDFMTGLPKTRSSLMTSTRNRRVNMSAAQYAEIWDAVIPSMKSLSNVMIGEPDVLVSGDLAVMSVQFVTSFLTAQGEVGRAHTLSSLVWRRSGESWRIIREHGSGITQHRD